MTLDNDSNPLPKKSGGGLGLGGGVSQPSSSSTPAPESLLEKPDTYQKEIRSVGEGFTPEAFSWKNSMLETVGANASSWFEAVGTKVPNELLKLRGYSEFKPEEKERMPWLFDDQAPPILSQAIVTQDELGELVPLPDSPLGQKLEQALQDHGVSWHHTDRLAIGASDEDIGAVLFAEIDLKFEGQGQWENGFGTSIVQYFRVHKLPDGSEEIFWFFDALVASRAYAHLNSRQVVDAATGNIVDWQRPVGDHELRIGQICEELSIPSFATRAFYLAETPFPSTAAIMKMSRSLAYPDVDEKLYPVPTIYYARDEFATGFLRHDSSENTRQYMHSLFPTVIRMGWRISDMSVDDLKKVLPTVVDGVTKISTMIEDGYRNFNNSEFPAPFDSVLDSAATFNFAYVPGETSTGGFSQWMPGSLVGFRLEETVLLNALAFEVHANGETELADTYFDRLTADGFGILVSNAINTFAFSYLFPQGDFGYAEWLLDAASRLPAGYQAINAKSNRGIALYELGRVEEAEQIFREILELPPNASESEASYYLWRIVKEGGDSVEAEQWFERCVAAGGYEPFDAPEDDGFSEDAEATEDAEAIEASDVSEPQADEPAPTLVKFCSQCGTPRASEEAKFCAMCGQAF